MAVPAALAVAVLSSAAPSHTYVGESDQGFPVRAVVRRDGAIDRIRVQWAAPCPVTGYVWGPEATMWFNRQLCPFKVAGRRFSDHGTNRFPFQGGHGVMTQRLSGRLSAKSLSGAQASTVRVYDKSGSCSTRAARRSASRRRRRLPMQPVL